MTTQLWQRGAFELAGMIADGVVSSREVIDAHLARVDEVNGELNAVTVELGERARAEATAADGAAEADRGPLHGVPFTIKENIDLVGAPTTHGLAAFAEAMPTEDAVTVARLRGAGAIPIGRTNMPELGMRVSTDNNFRGLTRNPWTFDRTAGGSSGGEGSAIASGMSPLGLGNDIGGSIRNPAICNGVAGLKPGYGRIPRVASLPPQDPGISGQLMAVEGPLARSVADLRGVFELLAGRHPRDPRVFDTPIDGPDVPRRAGVVRTAGSVAVSDWSLAGVDAAAAALAGAGWEIEEIELPELDLIKELWGQVLSFDVAAALPVFQLVMGEAELELLGALVAGAAEFERPASAAFIERLRLQRAWTAMFSRLPVVLAPGWLQPPFEHGADVADGEQLSILDEYLPTVVPANLLSYPVVSMTTAEHGGLPSSVQIYADHGREDLCLAAGLAIEAVTGVRTPIDPVWT